MSALEKGMRVQHAALGLGEIVAVEKAVHGVLATSDARFATRES